MKIAYTKVNLADKDQRNRLVDDIRESIEDETARLYLEDIQQFMDELEAENDYYIEQESERA